MIIFDEDKLVNNPVISVIVITYNHEKYLSQCLDNILSQNINVEYEIIIGEDCSKDKTKEICYYYKDKYPNIIKLILHETNVGLINNYLSLLNSARGKYITQISGDDYWCDNNKIQMQLDFMESNHNVGLCYTDYNYLKETTNEMKKNMFQNNNQYRPQTYEQHLLSPGYLAPMTWFYRNNVVKFESFNQVDESYSMMLEWMKNSEVAYMPKTTAVYRSNIGSASQPRKIKRRYEYIKGIFDMQVYYIKKYPCEPSLKERILMRGYLDVLPIAVKAKKNDFIEEARNYFISKSFNIDSIIRDLIEGDNRLHSNAYKLGKFLLKPLSKLRKLF